MGIELARAYVRVGADTSTLSSGLSQAREQTMSTIDSISNSATASMTNLMARLTSNATVVAGAVAGILHRFKSFGEGILRGGIASAAQFEEDTIAMETFLGSADEAKKTLDALTEFAVKTPFEMPGILQVARGMIQFGERGEGLMDTMRLMADASGGTAHNFQILGLVLNQIRGVGKLLTGDFRQLSTRGIISLQDIANYYKVSTQEAQEMLSRGRISFDDFKKIMKSTTEEGGRFYKMSEKQSQSLNGLISTFNDAKRIVIRVMASTLIPVVKTVMDQLIKMANAAERFVTASKSLASGAFLGATAFAAVGTKIAALITLMRILGITWKAVFIGTGIGAIIIAMGAGVGYLVAKYQEWIKTMIATSGIIDKVKAIGVGIWASISSAVQVAITNISGWLEFHKTQFLEIWNLIQETAMNVWSIISEIFSSVSSMLGEMFSNAVPHMVGFGAMVLDTFRDIMDWLSLMTTNWRLTWELIKTNTAIALVSVADKAMMVFNTLKALLIATGKTAFQFFYDVFTNIPEIVQSAATLIMGIFKGMWESIKSGFTGGDFIEPFKNEFVKAMGEIQNQMPDIGSRAMDTFQNEFASNLGPDSPLGDTIKELGSQADQIKKQMEAERMMKRSKEAGKHFFDDVLGPGAPVPPELAETLKPKAPEAAAKKASDIALEAGRYGISDIGNKIQDMLLKSDKVALDTKRNSLLEQGLKKQDDLITAVKESGSKPGTLG